MNKSIKKGLILFLGLFLGFSVIMGVGLKVFLEKEHQAKMQENEENKVESLEVKDPEIKERVNILLMGVDFLDTSNNKGQRGTRTDTIMLFSYDPISEQSFLLSIPRDSRVPIEGHGLDKINHAHSYGGTELSIKTITEFLGVPTHHYAKVDYKAISELVDAMGGIDMDVKQNMYYGALNINFKKGFQRLNGEQAVKYLRYRSYPNGDEDRVLVQQGFIQELMKKLLTPATIANLPQYIDIMNKNVETDMSKKQMLEMATLFLKSDPSKLRKEVIPGKGQYIGPVSYYVVYENGMKTLLDELMSSEKWVLPEDEMAPSESSQSAQNDGQADKVEPVKKEEPTKQVPKVMPKPTKPTEQKPVDSKPSETPQPIEKPKPVETPKQENEKPKSNGKTVRIASGSSAKQIANYLKSQGVISDSDAFLNSIVSAGKESNLQAGKFFIPEGSSHSQIISIITK